MNHVIKVDGHRSVIVTFKEATVQQLTPQGLRDVDMVTCFIETAEGLVPLGTGSSLRAPEDVPERYAGFRMALKRAAEQAFPDDRGAQAQLRQLLFQVMPKINPQEKARILQLRDALERSKRDFPGYCDTDKCSLCESWRGELAELERKAAA